MFSKHRNDGEFGGREEGSQINEIEMSLNKQIKNFGLMHGRR